MKRFVTFLLCGIAFSVAISEQARAFSVLANYPLNGSYIATQGSVGPMTFTGGTATYVPSERAYAISGATPNLQTDAITMTSGTHILVSVWFKITSYPSPGTRRPIIVESNNDLGAFVESDGTISLLDGGSNFTSSTLTVPLNEFNNVTLSSDGTLAHLYLNGTRAAVIPVTSLPSRTTRRFRTAYIAATSSYFIGSIRNLHVYDNSGGEAVRNLNATGTFSFREALTTGVPDSGSVTFNRTLTGTILLSNSKITPRNLVVCEPYQSIEVSMTTANVPTLDLFSGFFVMSGLTLSGGNIGGGIELTTCNAKIDRCTFRNNYASGNGGAIRVLDTGTLLVTNSTFEGNTAFDGGAVFLMKTSSSVFVNCTFANNLAQGRSMTAVIPGRGGAIFDGGDDPALTLTNCTIVGNNATGTGGGIYGIPSETIGLMRNTIVANNTAPTAPDISGVIITNGSTNNLVRIGTGLTGITDAVNGNLIGTTAAPREPLLTTLGSWGNQPGPTQTFALLPGSPAINAGTTRAGIPARDQRGNARVGATDIGAFESQGFALTMKSGNGQQCALNTPFPAPLVCGANSSAGEPVAGGVVTFTAPTAGASCTFPSGNPVRITLNTNGDAIVTPTANNTLGSYTVAATANGASGTNFSLTNQFFQSPSAQPTGLIFLTVQPTLITGQFTAASPVPTGYIVLRRTSPPSTPPVDGTTYTVGQTFGTSTVIALGSGVTFSDNTVVFNQTYIYEVYAYNGSGANINYLQSAPLTGIQTALPVELTLFEAQNVVRGMQLRWTTASEQNNAGFEVQRRSVNREVSSEAWQVLGFVRGNGTTSEAQSYSFLDRSASGKVQYRLKQVDFDGQFEYSNVIEVDAGLPKTFALEQNYPNPFNPTTVISYQLPVASNVSLKVYDVLGKEVMTLVNARQAAGSYTYTLNASKLASGIYFYRLQAGNFVQTKKMMLVK